MSDLDKAVRQDMKQKPPDKLSGVNCHDLALVVIGIIPPSERDLIGVRFHDSMVADRDSVSVSAEILKNAFGPVERRLAVDDPLLLVQIGNQGIERRRLRKMAYGAGVNKFVLGAESFQIGYKLSPKELRHHFDREEKVILARLPFPSITGQPAAGDDSMEVRMVHEVLSPGVDNTHETEADSETLRVLCQFPERLGDRAEEKVIQDSTVP